MVAAQLLAAAQPALAAELVDDRIAVAQQRGAFAGARVRVPLGTGTGAKARAGLTLVPVVQKEYRNGAVRTQYGEGLELGVSGNEKLELSLAGKRVSQLTEGKPGPDGSKAGISTIGWVAIGVGVVLVAVFVLAESCRRGDICGSDRDP